MTTCGLWHSKRNLVAALIGPGGEPRRLIRSALTSDARYGLIEFLAGAETQIVAAEAFARADLLPQQAARRGLIVWTASDGLVAALLRAAAIRDPARAATLLARLPAIALFRASLRRLTPQDAQPRQLPLI